MLSYTKEGVSLSLFHENRYATKNNLKAIKLVVCFRRQRKYFPTGVNMTDEGFSQLFVCRKRDSVESRQSLERTFYKYRTIIDYLLEKNKFSFDNIERELNTNNSGNTLLIDCFKKRLKRSKAIINLALRQIMNMLSKQFLNLILENNLT